MAKKMMHMKTWIMEVAPSPLVLPLKPSSHSPKLETIREDRAEGRDENDDGNSFLAWLVIGALIYCT
ncbi:hypothetical protein ACH5RR_020970 [Cinchona calisaya]|uniref:Uncharacterized protein n=1 Tax=Cinchona calisaya TaxID=153742 RepID=A0ABD2ZHS5_9GENT